MNETLAKFTAPEQCKQFAISVQQNKPELAQEARRRAVEFGLLLWSTLTRLLRYRAT